MAALEYVDQTLNWTNLKGLQDSMPIGSVIMWASDNIPNNWLLCDGSKLSKTSSDYVELYKVIGDNWGSDGNNFHLPDATGYFPRGKDINNTDPDGQARTNRYAGGTSGKNVGSYQNDTFGTHNHTITQAGDHRHIIYASGIHDHVISTAGQHSHFVDEAPQHIHHIKGDQGYYTVQHGGNPTVQCKSRFETAGGTAQELGADWSGQHRHYLSLNGNHVHLITQSGDHMHSISNNGNHLHQIFNEGGNETRPKNFYINFIIKYK